MGQYEDITRLYQFGGGLTQSQLKPSTTAPYLQFLQSGEFYQDIPMLD